VLFAENLPSGVATVGYFALAAAVSALGGCLVLGLCALLYTYVVAT
jgi:hypothetical protein